MIILLVAAYLLVSWFQIRSLAQKKHVKDLIVFCALMAFSFVVSLLFMLGVKLPNPISAINSLLDILGLHY